MGWHISGEPGEVAERILLPGDPLRAKHAAEVFLTDVKQFNSTRNILGYTGFYKGERISVMGTGMGMPSISIYVNELIKDYGVKRLVRVGTCGAMQEYIKVRDVVIAQSCTTDSSMIRNTFGPCITFSPTADYSFLERSVAVAREYGIKVHVGNVLSQDRLYDDEINLKKLQDYGVLAAEMEAAALYLLAAKYHVEGLALFTVSNHLITGEETTPEERTTTFNDMLRIAFEAAIR